ncbi:hypothetical protein [Variovorax terrae]|uniref:Uncharacterized protein n=1 Tax=Variovorax terrae TaxID=2923278 RepID=A0A9X1VTZ1_9BURK|nr:hypothetical protein [Variovorax terrae]MCJ0763225.1 hypothetical protein [Variovorax terrae]
MRWIKPSLRHSVYSLLGGTPPPVSESTLESRTEDIREQMLDSLGQDGARQFTQITRRVRYAGDVQALWYLRGELMAALAAMHGEALARDTMGTLTAMFQGLVPEAQGTRRRSTG